MKVKELCKYLKIENDNEKEINNIVTSTLDVKKGDVLICVKGDRVDPNLLLTTDIVSKTCLILSDDIDTPYTYVENLKEKVFSILDYFYFNHKHRFKIIGITGTEGKSSLAQILQQGLFNENKKSLLISNELSNKYSFKVDRTTPDSKTIIDAMIVADKLKVDYLIMEVSSIAISKCRISPLIFDYVFLTNLEEDHLDYHKNIYNYHLTKLNFMIKNLKGIKYVFSDTYSKYPNMFSKMRNVKVISKDNIKIKNNSLSHQVFIYEGKKYYTHLIFKENCFNLIFLIELLKTIGILNHTKTISKIRRIKGRLDLIYSRPYIIIDYAHSYKALENILKQVSMFKQNKIITVCGAGGNRDKSKRKKYGDVLYKYSDVIYLSNDNPRNEDEMSIVNMIKGSYKDKFNIILDRKKAIESSIKNASKDDIVLVLGRGNEQYQEINNNRYYLNDYEVCYKCLSK